MSEYRHIANLKGPGADLVDPTILSASDNLDALPAGIYRTNFEETSEALGLPGGRNGVLERLVPTTSQRYDRFTSNFTNNRPAEIWVRGQDSLGVWSDWEQIYPKPSPQDNPVIPVDASVFDLEPGEYRVDYDIYAIGNGLPVAEPGYVKIIRSTASMRTITFTPSYGDIGTLVTNPYEVWVCGMDIDRTYRPMWDRVVSGGTHIRATQAVVTDGDRESVFTRNPDQVDRPASTLKIMTAHVARTVVTDQMLDETVEFTEQDTVGGSSADLQVGDVLTWRDLFHGLMLPSGNDAASCIARVAGELLSGTGDPYQTFIDQMNTTAQSYGWEGAVFVDPSGLSSDNQVSVNQLTDLLHRVVDEDSWLLGVMGTYRHEMTVTGTNARTYDVTHSFDPLGEVAFPEAIAAKTGTLGTHTCLALVFEGPNGETCTAVLTGSYSTERYPDMRSLVDAGVRFIDVDAPTGGTMIPETNINHRIEGLTGGDMLISRNTGAVSLTFAVAELPASFDQEGFIPPTFRPEGQFNYGLVNEGARESGTFRLAQAYDNGRLQVDGNAEGEPIRGTMTWTATQ